MTGARSRIDVAGILATVDLAALVMDHGIRLTRSGRKWRGLCPFHGERSPSFYVYDAGQQERAHYHCFGCGAHGDAIGFLVAHKGLSFLAAVEELGGERGAVDPDVLRRRAEEQARADARREAERLRQQQKDRLVWEAAKPAAGTPVESYLWARRIKVDAIGGVPAALRHAILDYWCVGPDERPVSLGRFHAMVARVSAPERDDRLLTVHVTYLDRPVGKPWGKLDIHDPWTGEVLPAKKLLGRTQVDGVGGGAIRLGPVAPDMLVGEGIETSLAGSSATARHGPPRPAWCGISLGNISGGGLGDGSPHPMQSMRRAHGRSWPRRLPSAVPNPEKPGLWLPAEVVAPHFLVDMDAKDVWSFETVMQRIDRRWRAEGRRPRFARPPRGHDFASWNAQVQE